MARSSRLESGFQDRLIETIKERFPGCMVFKMDQVQGIPDLLILHKDKWASLECKKSAGARKQPNQPECCQRGPRRGTGRPHQETQRRGR